MERPGVSLKRASGVNRARKGAPAKAIQGRCRAGYGWATWMLALMCLRRATIVNVITTSSDHELHLLTCTTDQAPSWFG